MNSSLCPLNVITPFRFLILLYCTFYLSKRLRSNQKYIYFSKLSLFARSIHDPGLKMILILSLLQNSAFEVNIRARQITFANTPLSK